MMRYDDETMSRNGYYAQQADGPAEVFTTRLATRIGSFMSAGFVTVLCAGAIVGCIALARLILSRPAGVREASGSIYGVAFFSVMVPVIVWIWWTFMKGRFKFTLRVMPDRIEYGRGIFRETFPCDDVDIIRVKFEGTAEHVKLGIPGRTWICRFREDSQRCADLLRAYCPNAIYIDVKGSEHLPANPGDPVQIVKRLVGTIRSRGRWTLGGGVLMTYMGGSIAFARIFGKPPPESINPVFGYALFLVLVVGGPLTIKLGWQRLGKARKLQAKLSQLVDDGGMGLFADMGARR